VGWLDVPAVSRVWDYLLGGSHNTAADRAVGDLACRLVPDLPEWVWAHRRFTHRAVRFLLDQGVRQFLDLGSGLPTLGAVHQVAQRVDPGARAVYVDCDRFAVVFTRMTLADVPGVGAVHADLRDAEAVLSSPAVRRLLDPGRPTGLLLTAVVDQLPDTAQTAAAVAAYHDRLAVGSWVVLTHATADGRPPDALAAAAALTAQTRMPVVLRTAAEIGQLIDGFVPAPPGLVRIPAWRPDQPNTAATADGWGRGHPDRCPGYAVVASSGQPPTGG
jgi:hypothetical protein